MRNLIVTAATAALLIGTPATGSAAKCDGSGVADVLANAKAQCCPADNMGQFVSCAAHLANKAVKAGTLAASCKREILQSEGCAADATTTTTVPVGATTTTTMPSSGAAGHVEICGNCIDDDGNGLTDFEDPACCPAARSFTMIVKRARLRPRGPVTRLRLRALLDHGFRRVNPLRQDVTIQIRPVDGSDVLCARIPAERFNWWDGGFKFKDQKGTVAGAQGLAGMRFKFRPDGTLRVRAMGGKTRMPMPAQHSLAVTIGFHDGQAGDAANLCSTAVENFRPTPRGALRLP